MTDYVTTVGHRAGIVLEMLVVGSVTNFLKFLDEVRSRDMHLLIHVPLCKQPTASPHSSIYHPLKSKV